MVKIENWYMERVMPSAFSAPELATFCLVGNAYGHHNCYEGEHVRTTPISHKETIEGKVVVVTLSGTKYLLGEPQAGYEAQFPGSRDRLLNTIKEKQ